jgi:hypothetical protein
LQYCEECCLIRTPLVSSLHIPFARHSTAQGKKFSPKQNAQGMKLESKVESKIEAKNAKGPKSGNRNVEKRMDSEREAPTNKPLTL